jgi:predicted phage replisome organizer
MADNEKYYYIKLKDNYFEQDNIKVLESMKNGHIYSLIIIKMYLKASKTDGQLMMTQRLPYDPSNVDILASVLGHDVDHVKEAIRLGVQLDLIKIIDGKEIWMTEIQNMIGQSSTEADRVRLYRKKLDEKLLPESTDVQMYDKSTPEIERELEIEKKIEKKKELENSCGEVSSETISASPVFISLPKIGSPSQPNATHNVTEEDIKEYENVYPGIDVRLELKKMKLWLDSNPANKKKNVKSFIARWLAKSQDRSRGDSNGKHAKTASTRPGFSVIGNVGGEEKTF